MTAWDRIQSMQLELAQKEAHIRRLINQRFDAQRAELEQRQNVLELSEQVEDLRRQLHARTEERDTARRVAMRLEEENHHLAGAVCALCGQELVVVPVIGEAT